MCAIFGLVKYRHLISKKHLKTLINRLAVASEVRGTDASGIAYVKNGKLVIYKRPLPAHKMHFFSPKVSSPRHTVQDRPFPEIG